MIAARATAVPRRAGFAVLAVVALALLPGQASAGCGDSVTVRYGAAAEEPMDGPAADRHMPTGPCHGPDCSGRPSVPFAPAAPPVSQATDVKACPITSDDPGGSGSERVAPAPWGRGPIDRPTPIFHPPRA